MPLSHRRSTASLLIQQLMQSMGMTPTTDAAGAQDKMSMQFWQLATDVGQQLAMEPYKWQVLSRFHGIVTSVGISTYDLPIDFNGYISDANWNRTTQMPVIGSLEQFEWQALQAQVSTGGTFRLVFRVERDSIVFYSTPTAEETIVLPYTSRYWVQDGADDTTFKDSLEANNDVVMYDPQLFKIALKRAWYTAKGFDITVVEREYQKALSAAKGSDVPGRTISIVSRQGHPYLGVLNVPTSGFGV